MRDTPVWNIIRTPRPVSLDAPIARAAETMRVAGISEVPVISGSQVIGMVTEASVLRAYSEGEAKDVGSRSVESILTPVNVFVSGAMSVGKMSEIMDEHDLDIVPVLDAMGSYGGVVCRTDVIGILSLTMRPPSVGGLATPLGVYLTTGQVSGGAGFLGLFLTGIALGAMRFGSGWLANGLGWLLASLNHTSLLRLLHQPLLGPYVNGGLFAVAFIGFLALLRFLPLSGYHAAEHQVVNAIEHGEPLTVDIVRTMPRVHPRCGTNLLAAVTLFLMVSAAFTSDVAVLITIFVLVFAWRTIGGYFQTYVTTKPPTEKQIRSGIKAGEELMETYRRNPAYRVTGWKRIWNTGMLQVMIGMIAITSLAQFLVEHVPALHRVFPIMF